MTVPIHRPNTELVAVAWLKTIAGLPAGKIGTTLPDASAWADTGFVQCPGVVGGSPDVYVALRSPVVQVDCWATRLDSDKPPWGQANTLAETIVNACYSTPGPITLRDEFFEAKVFEVIPLTEPRRVPEDPASFARYSLDLLVQWIQTEE